MSQMILHGDSKLFEYLGGNETKNETILTHWSVTQAGSNDDKNWGSKMSSDCPLKYISFPFPSIHSYFFKVVLYLGGETIC